MHMTIAAVGNKMPDWVANGCIEYVRRMPPECRVELKEIKPIERAGSNNAITVMALERKKIEAALPKGTFIVALDEHGKDVSSQQLAHHLQQWRQDGRDVAFVIGGADGLDAGFKASADMLIRVSSLTLPHGMVRIVLAEQLYRAWSIIQNHPYHRV